MKSYKEIAAEIRGNLDRIEELTNEIIKLDRINERRNAAELKQWEAVKAMRDEAEQNAAAIEERTEEIVILKLVNCILRENRRHALAAAAIPVITEAFSKYNGKPYGEKTREKISQEIRAAGFSAWTTNDGNILELSALDENGYTHGGRDIEFWSYQNPFITSENKINISAFYSIKIKDRYTEDPRKAAEEIREKYKEMKKALEAAAVVAGEYNALIYEGMKKAEPPRAPYTII